VIRTGSLRFPARHRRHRGRDPAPAGRERYPETYAASGGIIYTAVSMGCGAVLLVAGGGLMALALIFRH